MKKIFGKFLIGLSKVLDKVFGFLIAGMSIIVSVLSGFSTLLILFAIALLFIGWFAIPVFFILVVANPIAWLAIFLFFVVPFLGKKFISFLRYSNYTVCEYLTNYGNYMVGNGQAYKSFREFSDSYENKMQEEARRAREERQRMEQEAWEARFREFNEYFRQSQGFDYGNYQNYNQNTGYNFSDPYSDFVKKFEDSCRELEIENFNVDFYEIKLQYRKLAKKYHPDLNPNEDTTSKIQSINAAFEFLTEDNINRYKQINRR